MVRSIIEFLSGSLGPVYAHTVSARRVAEVVDDRKLEYEKLLQQLVLVALP